MENPSTVRDHRRCRVATGPRTGSTAVGHTDRPTSPSGAFVRDGRVISSRADLVAAVAETVRADPRTHNAARDVFSTRLEAHTDTLLSALAPLYGETGQFWDVARAALIAAWEAFVARPEALTRLDEERERNPGWFLSRQTLGGVCYVDRYAGDLEGIRQRIPYFRELGLSYLHLMPLYRTPPGNSDGGYAVTSHRELDPQLGRMGDLERLADDLRDAGIALVLDFVANHTANDHAWALAAAAGDPYYERFYWIYEDRVLPDEFERHTREIFPEEHPGVFTRLTDTHIARAASPRDEDPRWVWTTFQRNQWDLNYSNPHVFAAMAEDLLFLANRGAQVLRLDAVAFLWKRLGTACESLPEVHEMVRAFHALTRLACPAVEFKAEAIVHPDEVIRYVGTDQCALAYNPLQAALTWEAVATRDVSLLHAALEQRHGTPEGTAWVNYVRSHDDIGWTFSDDDAARLGIDPRGHREFLNRFYTGDFPGSFADGVAFQYDPRTGDRRVCGTTASLMGLEREPGPAVDRILLAHSIAMSTGGVPLLYLGDEVGQLNDPTWAEEPLHAQDARWTHRPRYPEQDYARRHDLFSVQGRIFGGIQRMAHVRRSTEEFEGTRLIPFVTHNPHVLGYQRPGAHATVLCLANFSDWSQYVTGQTLSGFSPAAVELHGNRQIDLRRGILLDAHGFTWVRVFPAG